MDTATMYIVNHALKEQMGVEFSERWLERLLQTMPDLVKLVEEESMGTYLGEQILQEFAKNLLGTSVPNLSAKPEVRQEFKKAFREACVEWGAKPVSAGRF